MPCCGYNACVHVPALMDCHDLETRTGVAAHQSLRIHNPGNDEGGRDWLTVPSKAGTDGAFFGLEVQGYDTLRVCTKAVYRKSPGRVMADSCSSSAFLLSLCRLELDPNAGWSSDSGLKHYAVGDQSSNARTVQLPGQSSGPQALP